MQEQERALKRKDIELREIKKFNQHANNIEDQLRETYEKEEKLSMKVMELENAETLKDQHIKTL